MASLTLHFLEGDELTFVFVSITLHVVYRQFSAVHNTQSVPALRIQGFWDVIDHVYW
jgi:hypothetical protein